MTQLINRPPLDTDALKRAGYRDRDIAYIRHIEGSGLWTPDQLAIMQQVAIVTGRATT